MSIHKRFVAMGFGIAIAFFLFMFSKKAMDIPPRLWIDDIPFRVDIADSDSKRAQGLQGRISLPITEGMLFLFPEKTMPDFWMKKTRIPLDILWIADGTIVDMTLNVQPELLSSDQDLQRYRPSVPVDSVLELNAGIVTALGFSIGDSVRGEF